MKLWILIVLALLSILLTEAQLYFPSENDGNAFLPSQPLGAASAAAPVNLSEIRGTPLYEEYVNKIIARGITKLTLAVDKAVSSSTNDFRNIVYAPVSIAAALALVLLGANGKTFEEIVTIMGLATGVDVHSKSQLVHENFGRILKQLQDQSGFSIGNQVNFATAIFVQNNYPIRTIYKQVAGAVYESEIINVDFQTNPVAAQNIVNNWVNQRTLGKIPDILKETPQSTTRVILTSAMYFKAAWEKPFFSGSTKRRPFFPNGRKSKSNIMVEMMSNGGYFPYYKDTLLNCEIMGFPYKGNKTTMYVVMPFNSDQEKLKEFRLQLNETVLDGLVDNVRYTRSIILFPKMKIDSTIDLKQALQLLGLRSLFNPNEANLALLSPGISNNLQQPQIVRDKMKANEDFQGAPPIQQQQQQQPQNRDDIFIFSRLRDINCTNDGTQCPALNSRTADNGPISKTLDELRQYLNQQPNLQNPGLYADSVIHKVYMDITESGTEAAAATSVTLARDGGSVTFRIDVPFLFFIIHEQSKTILFWGSVNTPTPHF